MKIFLKVSKNFLKSTANTLRFKINFENELRHIDLKKNVMSCNRILRLFLSFRFI